MRDGVWTVAVLIPPPTPKWLTAPNDRAAERNNDFSPREALAAELDRPPA